MGEWSPLFDGLDRDRAIDAAVAVADALAAPQADTGTHDTAPTLNGTLGATLFLTALGETTGDTSYTKTAAALLDDAIGRAADVEHPELSLYGTPLGLGWAVAVLRPRLSPGEPDDENDVDTFVGNVLAADGWPWPVDLMHGLAGLGMYCLARLPLESARRNAAHVVRHLASLAEAEGPGVTWRYVPLPGAPFRFTEERPDGHVNVGFAHGVPGIVAFLAAAADADVAGTRDLLEPALRWLRAQRLPPGERSAFPKLVVPGRRPRGTRLAWCYGDPGVAVALLLAGRALGDGDVVEQARDVARRCAGQSPEGVDGDGVDGPTLCHGSAGLGHLFNRLGHALGDERVLDLARHWFGVTLDRDLATLTAIDRAAAKQVLAHGGRLAVEPGPGMLFGAAGTGLALLAATSDQEPWWDGVLFVQRPGRWSG